MTILGSFHLTHAQDPNCRKYIYFQLYRPPTLSYLLSPLAAELLEDFVSSDETNGGPNMNVLPILPATASMGVGVIHGVHGVGVGGGPPLGCHSTPSSFVRKPYTSVYIVTLLVGG